MGFEWANSPSRQFLSKGYLVAGDTVENRVRVIADTAEKILGKEGFADKFYEYMSRGYYSLSSPVWSNFGTERGLPISCNNVFVNDNMASILKKVAEVGMQTKHGAGTSVYLGELRPRGTPISGGGAAFGPIHFMNMWEVTTDVVSQSNVRRGSCAAYLPIDHPDIEEFLECREQGSSIQNMSLGVSVKDYWMEDMIAGDSEKRKIWARILRKRRETGYPYIFFHDTVNDAAPQAYKDQGRTIWSSNLCSEIALSSSEDESFVCNLASMNLLTYDEWKDNDAVEVMTYFLDAVMEEYIQKTKNIPFMESAYNFAIRWRALGIGQLGWHSYLQSKMIPFESLMAEVLAKQISKHIDERSLDASKAMAIEYGEPEGLKGYGVRNVTRTAIAPTTSSSFILGQVSPTIEPLPANIFTKDLAKGKFTYRNPYLEKVLEAYGKNDFETWDDILRNRGSVQHLDFLTKEEKDVFKTFSEITPMTIVRHAAARQKHIDQAQSLNLHIPRDAPIKDVNALIIEGWKSKVKTFYYQRSTNAAQDLANSILSCASCEA